MLLIASWTTNNSNRKRITELNYSKCLSASTIIEFTHITKLCEMPFSAITACKMVDSNCPHVNCINIKNCIPNYNSSAAIYREIILKEMRTLQTEDRIAGTMNVQQKTTAPRRISVIAFVSKLHI